MTKQEQQQREYELEVGEQVVRLQRGLAEYAPLYSIETLHDYVVKHAAMTNLNRAVGARVFNRS